MLTQILGRDQPILFNIDKELNAANIVNLSRVGTTSISVRQNQRYRWLEIAKTIQTVMDLSQPSKLVLPHLHGMALSLYYMLQPKSVLELGLGGGALQRFFHHFFPDTQFHSIELDPKIIEHFLNFFADGLNNPEQQVTQADAQEAIKHYQNLDLLFVDLFSDNAPPEFINDRRFYEDCFNALSPAGLIVINLLPVAEIQTMDVEYLLTEISRFTPAIFSIPQYKNRILIASRQALPKIPFDTQLQNICRQYQLDLMNIVQLK